MAVRGVGEKAVEAIIDERKSTGAFTSLYDFCERVDLRQVTRARIEALVKCGAFSSDCRPSGRSSCHVLERAVEMGQQAQNDKRMGQMNMFGAAATRPRRPGAAPATAAGPARDCPTPNCSSSRRNCSASTSPAIR